MNLMNMRLGEHLRLTLFGTSHGPKVGITLEGVPKGLMVDVEGIRKAMNTRRPGGRYASKRKEEDAVLVLSGVEQGRTTGEVVELSILNQDAKSKDYSFLPDHPRPGHQDMVMHKRTNGQADLRGGGMSSARLTAPLVAAAAFVAPLLTSRGIEVEAHVGAIASVESKPMNTQPERWANEACKEMRCRDPEAAKRMVEVVEHHRMNLNSVGSRVDLTVQGLPLGLGEPWFDGIEPAMARAMMSIPAARGVTFGRGFDCGWDDRQRAQRFMGGYTKCTNPPRRQTRWRACWLGHWGSNPLLCRLQTTIQHSGRAGHTQHQHRLDGASCGQRKTRPRPWSTSGRCCGSNGDARLD